VESREGMGKCSSYGPPSIGRDKAMTMEWFLDTLKRFVLFNIHISVKEGTIFAFGPFFVELF
jgi:hypothetical protein